MPRKVNYVLDYDDGYDNYDDYDYDHEVKGDGYNEDNVASQLGKDASKHGIWLCPICSYDNEETLFCCDICGAIQVYASNYGKQKVHPASKDTGASVMSKSHAESYMTTPKTNNLDDVFQSKRPNLYEKDEMYSEVEKQ